MERALHARLVQHSSRKCRPRLGKLDESREVLPLILAALGPRDRATSDPSASRLAKQAGPEYSAWRRPSRCV